MRSFPCLVEVLLAAALGITLLHPTAAECPRQRWQCFANHGAAGSSVSERLIGEPLLLNTCAGADGVCTVYNCGKRERVEAPR